MSTLAGAMADWLNDLRAEGERATRLATDLEFYAGEYLRIRTKQGPLASFQFNPAQRELHRRIEEQKAKTGKVRVIVLKARQLGISTYVAARFYKSTTSNPGLRTQIIAHEKAATRNLFNLVKRFHENTPADVRQSVGTSNADELVFDTIDSGYLCATATTEGAGRSSTAQFAHLSEVAFWQSLQEQLAALVQTIPDLPGTEIIIETTGNQYGDSLHQLWRKAEAGESEFIPVFLPYSIDPTYRAELPENFAMTGDEKALAELHGLDAQQIMWRRNKISQIGNEDYFAREFPLTPDQAFMASQFDSFITAPDVLRARKEKIEPYGALLIGVDPAGQGDDSTAIAWRRGHCIEKVERRHKLTTMEIAGLIQKIITDEKPAKVAIDVGGLGIGVFERLVEQGHGEVVSAVNFGSKALEPPPLDDTGKPSGGNANRRAELWSHLRTALQGRFSIPDDDALHADLTSCGYRYDSNGRLLLESKQDMRKRGMPSPDGADAIALCFAEPGGAAIPRSIATNFNRKKIEYGNMGYA
jgi:hypothetical protein